MAICLHFFLPAAADRLFDLDAASPQKISYRQVWLLAIRSSHRSDEAGLCQAEGISGLGSDWCVPIFVFGMPWSYMPAAAVARMPRHGRGHDLLELWNGADVPNVHVMYGWTPSLLLCLRCAFFFFGGCWW